MQVSRESSGSLPRIDEISEEMILSLRHPDSCRVCQREKEYETCKGGDGTFIGTKHLELYSSHYIHTVDVYGCDTCGSIWWEHVSSELA
jgi:hypothetical protein